MSDQLGHAGRASGLLGGAITCLAMLLAATPAGAEGYLVAGAGPRRSSYDGAYAGESVLVAPDGTRSIPSVTAESLPSGMTEAFVTDDQFGSGWPDAGCTACGDRGCNACEPSGCRSGLCGPACPRWVVQVDALMLWQGNIASRPLFVNAAGFPALDANQAGTPMSAGPRVGLSYYLDQTHAIEGNYFNVRPFGGEATALPGQSLTAQNLAGISRAGYDGAQVFTNGAIQSAELNWRRSECWCPITWLAGFRWVEWNQQMRVTGHDIGPVTEVFAETGNDLYGGQGGLELGLWNAGGPFTVTGVGKAGVFYNTAFQRTSFADLSGSGSAAAIADQTSFFGELGVNGSLQLTRWLSWRVGYSLFWISGVAVPANQLATTNLTTFPPTATINTTGSVFLQGATTGLEARW